MLKRLLPILGVLVMLAAACGGDNVHSDVTTVRDATSVQAGADLYAANCAACHGAGLEGGSGPNLVTSELGHPDADFVKAITEGEGEMPGFGGDLTTSEIQSLVDFVRTMQAAGLEE